jgi:hypothetical protein
MPGAEGAGLPFPLGSVKVATALWLRKRLLADFFFDMSGLDGLI